MRNYSLVIFHQQRTKSSSCAATHKHPHTPHTHSHTPTHTIHLHTYSPVDSLSVVCDAQLLARGPQPTKRKRAAHQRDHVTATDYRWWRDPISLFGRQEKTKKEWRELIQVQVCDDECRCVSCVCVSCICVWVDASRNGKGDFLLRNFYYLGNDDIYFGFPMRAWVCVACGEFV